jgi:predicted Zn-dependent protease
VGENGTRHLIRLAPIVLGLLAIGFVMMRGCQKGPFGRRQLRGLTPEQEARLGAQAYKEVLAKEQVIDKGPVVQAVRDVADRLIAAARSPEFLNATKQPYQPMDWQVSVVRSKQVNAFCLPGGKIVVYTAILPVAKTDAGLATVMGHEIAHALAHHGAERLAQQKIAQIGATAVGTSLGNMSPDQRRAVMQAFNFGAQAGLLKYSRKHETEADQMGLYLMATAGYDPREASRFWQRMAKASRGGSAPEFLSTHPSHDTRINNLREGGPWMKVALQLYENSPDKTKPKDLPLGGI